MIDRKPFGSDLNILPGTNKALPASQLNSMKLNLTAHRSDHEIHTPEHRNGYLGKNFFEPVSRCCDYTALQFSNRERFLNYRNCLQTSVAEDEKSLIGSLEHLQRQLIEEPASWPSRNRSPKLKSISLDDDDTLVIDSILSKMVAFYFHTSNSYIVFLISQVQTSASALLLDSSDSRSVSSTSFISAVSSQEDLTLVNLHMQVNKPIVDSPLLISTYINHLSQV